VKMVEKRVMAFIKDLRIIIERERINVAISAHNDSMRPFRRYFENISIKEMIELENLYDKYFDYTIEF
jgi:bisphosphoglycerate-dependent phosphoglycerate mutase